MTKWNLFQRYKAGSIYYINRLKKRSHIIISVNGEKKFGKSIYINDNKFQKKIRWERTSLTLEFFCRKNYLQNTL